MSKVVITEQYLKDIGDAIREKNSSNEVYYPSEMAQAVLDIPTASGGLYLTTSLILVADTTETVGPVTLTATLKADYDDLTPADVDLHGFLKGATVTFYDSTGTSLGFGITNMNGIVTLDLVITSNITIYCVFNGTSDYNECTSNSISITNKSLFYDTCATSDTLSYYETYIPIRNGTSVMSHSNDYHIITNTKGDSESFIPITNLTGKSDFTIEYDSYIEGSSGSSGLVIYKDNNNWAKLTDDGNNKYWIGYKTKGAFTEQGFTDVGYTYHEWIHNKFTIQGNTFSCELSRNGNVFFTKSFTLATGLLNNTTKFGLDSEWQQNTVTRYKNIVAEAL